jgi:hypothetical protein
MDDVETQCKKYGVPLPPTPAEAKLLLEKRMAAEAAAVVAAAAAAARVTEQACDDDEVNPFPFSLDNVVLTFIATSFDRITIHPAFLCCISSFTLVV